MIAQRPQQDEEERLEVLRQYDILDSPPEPAFDDLASLAANLCNTPISFITLVDKDRQWVKSQVGLHVCEVPREFSICAHPIPHSDLFMVPDTSQDGRFADHPWVTGDPQIRFYAGAPLKTPEGYVLGTLCVLDRVPRVLNARQQEGLTTLSRQVLTQLELRHSRKISRLKVEVRGGKNEFDFMTNAFPMPVAYVDSTLRYRFNNQAYGEFLGIPTGNLEGRCIKNVLGQAAYETLKPHIDKVFSGHQVTFEKEVPFSQDNTRYVEATLIPDFDETHEVKGFMVVVNNLTDRRRVEERFRLAVEAAPCGMVMSNQEGKIVLVNSQTERLFGYAREELMNQPIEILVPVQHRRKHRGYQARFCADLQQRPLGTGSVLYGLRKNGTTFPVEIGLNPIETSDGVMVLSSILDITERKRAEVMLQKQQNEYQTIFDSVPAMIWYIDKENTILCANELASQSIGLSLEEIRGKSAYDLYPDEAAKYQKDNWEVITSGKSKQGIIESYQIASGEKRWLRTDKIPYRDDQGNIVGVIVFAIDITEEKQAQEAVESSHNLLTTITEGTTDAVFVKDMRGRYLMMNSSGANILGKPLEEILGKEDMELFPPSTGRSLMELDQRVIATKQVYTAEEGITVGGITRIFLTTKGVCRDQAGKPIGLFGIARDITERKQAEEAINRLNQELEQRVIERTSQLETKIRESQEAQERIQSLAKFPSEDPNPVLRISRDGRVLYANKASSWLLKTWRCEEGQSLPEPWHQIALEGFSTSLLQQGEVECSDKVFSLIFAPIEQSNYMNIYGLDITEQKQRQVLLETMQQAQSQFILGNDPTEMFDHLLNNFLSITQSEYGFMGEILFTPEGKPYLQTQAITNIAWNQETRELYERFAPNLEFFNLNNLFGKVITTGQPVVANDPMNDPRGGGLPKGHPQMHAFLGLPFYRGDRLIGMVGIANRAGGYDEQLIAYLQPLLTSCGIIIEAYQNSQQWIQAEKALRQSEERLAMALEATSAGVWDWDLNSDSVFFSPRWLESLGFAPGELEPHLDSWKALVHPDDMPHVMDTLNAHLEGKTPVYECENRLLTKSGSWRWELDRGKVIARDQNGRALRMVGVEVDITERKQAEEKVRKALKEKEVLLKEIHHRVKNNLQVVSSLLSLQASRLADDQQREPFQVSQDRLQAMILIHEQLYRSENLAEISFGEFIERQANELCRAYGVDSEKVTLEIRAEGVRLDIDKAIPCGLIVTELLTNALKYAFPGEKAGKITIQLLLGQDAMVTLKISDNGVGLPDSLDIRHSNSLGMRLVCALTDQLEGNIELTREGGTELMIQFPR